MTSCAPTPFIRSKIPSPSRSSPPSTLSAGNLFGTTRRSHPGVFGPLPLWRYASTSGGVRSSRPAQKGQSSAPTGIIRSRRKSLGRLRRSVEMITQRPVMGSLRSSGTVECVLVDLDNRHAGFEVYGDHVKTARAFRQPVAGEVFQRQLLHPAALHPRDGFTRSAKRAAVTRLHFHEHQRRTIAGDDIQFSTAATIPARKNCVPAPQQFLA